MQSLNLCLSVSSDENQDEVAQQDDVVTVHLVVSQHSALLNIYILLDLNKKTQAMWLEFFYIVICYAPTDASLLIIAGCSTTSGSGAFFMIVKAFE